MTDSTDPAEQSEKSEQPEASPRRHLMPRGKARRRGKAAAVEPEAAEAVQAPEADKVAEADEVEVAEEAEGLEADTEADQAATEASAEEAEEPAAENVPAEDADGDESASTAEVSDDTDDTDDTADDDEVVPQRVVFVERKKPGRYAKIAIVLAAAVFIGAGAFIGAMLQPYLSERADVQTKVTVARVASSAVATLWTYTPDDMEQLTERSSTYLTGDFLEQYRKNIDAIVPTNKQAQVTNNTEVVGAAVESLDGPNATAIVYTNSTSSSPLTKNIPTMRYSSYRLMMERKGGQWMVNGMTSVTNLDLTPQI